MNPINDSLALVGSEISLGGLVVDVVLAAVLAALLGVFYERFGRSLSNRSKLARNFVIIAVTTTLVITVVKSSLALSLGLVGALSIVRFRAAIKEPEELAYLFLSISIGLGFGAGQRMVTVVAFGVILAVLYVQNWFGGTQEKENLYLSLRVKSARNKKVMGEVLDLLESETKRSDLRRVDDDGGELSLGVMVEFESREQMEGLVESLRKEFPKVKVSLFDASRLSQ